MASPEEDLLAIAWARFEVPTIDDLGELVGFTASAAWEQSRLLIWICDREQEQDRVLEEVASLVKLSPARRLGRIYELQPSSELLGLLAVLMVRTAWGVDCLRQQVTAGDSRAGAVLTGLLRDDRQLQHDLKIGLVARWRNSENEENEEDDLAATGVVGAVAREYQLRRELGARLLEWIIERGLKLSYPLIDNRSTRLSDRWDEHGLLMVLVDRIARMVLPLSPRAGELRVAAKWAMLDELKQRDAQKRGGDAIEESLDEDEDVTTAPASIDPEKLAASKEIIAIARQRLGDKAARYFEGIADDLWPEEAAEAAGVSTGMARRYQRLMEELLGPVSALKKIHRS
jgi:hypothetical protein